MCGLVGIAGQIGNNADNLMKHLLILDSLRGIDSTGLCSVGYGNNPDIKMAKCAGDPFILMDNVGFDKVLRGIHKVMIGHNRFSTVGKSTRANAHPFEIGNVIGAHNGTLTSKYALHEGHSFEVDSQALYNHIDKLGLESALTKMSGAWALTWFSKNDQRMHFLRNKERPLFIAFNKTNTGLIWASEEWMIQVAASRNKVEIQDPFFLKEDTHWSFNVNHVGSISDYTEEEAKGSFFVQPAHTMGRSTGHAGGNSSSVFPFPPANTGGANATGASTSKSTVSEGKWKRASDDTYTGSKGVTLKPTSIRTDTNGAEYLFCTDEENPGLIIRLYMNKRDNAVNYIGKTLCGNIGGFFTVDGKDSKMGYYKVDYGSVKLLRLFKGHKGETLNYADFVSQYPQCSWCQANANPHLDQHFTDGGELICHECAQDTEVKTYINFSIPN